MAKSDTMSRGEVWEQLEKKRYDDLKRKAIMLQGECLAKARCPVCTLQPPCKHYTSVDEIVSKAKHIINQPEYLQAISAVKRENLLRQLKYLKMSAFGFHHDPSMQFLESP